MGSPGVGPDAGILATVGVAVAATGGSPGEGEGVRSGRVDKGHPPLLAPRGWRHPPFWVCFLGGEGGGA